MLARRGNYIALQRNSVNANLYTFICTKVKYGDSTKEITYHKNRLTEISNTNMYLVSYIETPFLNYPPSPQFI